MREIYLYISQDDPYAARALQAEIRERVTLLQDNPHLGRPGRVDGTRELVMANNPYILPYRAREDRVEILAVYHGARKWPGAFWNNNFMEDNAMIATDVNYESFWKALPAHAPDAYHSHQITSICA